MQYRRVFFDFQTGDGFEEVTSLVKFDDLTYTVRAGSDNFHYAQNTANISLIYDATIYGKVRDNTADIVVRIIDTDETAAVPVVYTPRFWGHIAPTKSHNYNGVINITILKLEAIDDGDYLKKEVGDVCYRGFRIMDSANPNYSIVHQLAYRAGFTVAQIDSTVSIPAVLNAFVPPSTSDDIRDLLDALLFEYGYTLAFNAEGEISPIKWMYTAAALSFTFNETNIIDKLDVNDRLKEYDGAEVTYYELGEGTTTSGQTDILLYRDGDLPYADDGTFLGYAVLSGYTYPPLTNILDETTGEATVVYQEYEDTSIKYWTNKAITDKLDYNYKAFTSDFSSIVATSGHYLDYKADAGVSLVTSEFQNTQARIVFSGMNNTANLLYYCNVYGKVLYKTAERISTVVTISGSEDLDEYVSTFIFEKDYADTLVKFLALQYSTNNLEIEVVSSSDVAIGAMVQVVANDGTNELCRVVTKKYNEKTLQFTYTLYSYMYGSGEILPDLTSQTVSSPSRIGGVTSSVAVADLRAALGGELYVSTTGITRSRNGALLPDEVIADAKYKYDGTTYSGRFSVEVSGDGQTYHEHYKSITDEASHTFDVPTKTNVPDCQAYYPATGLSSYPDDPAGTTYIQDAWATVDGWNNAGGTWTVAAVDGELVITQNSSDGRTIYPSKSSISWVNSTVRVRFKSDFSGNVIVRGTLGGVANTILKTFAAVAGVYQIVDFYVAGTLTLIYVSQAGLALNQKMYIDFVYVGTGKYLDGSLQNQISDSYDATIYGGVPDGAGKIIRDGINDYERTVSAVTMPDIFHYHETWTIPNHATQAQLLFGVGTPGAARVLFYRVINSRALAILYWNGTANAQADVLNYFDVTTTELEADVEINWLTGAYIVSKNGVQFATGTLTAPVKPAAQVWYFGNQSALSSAQFCGGYVANRRWYNRALTALEVQQLYNDPTDPAYYTVDVRTRLYASGGFTTRIGEALCTVALESNASAIYWGALTSAPSSGFIAGDYYFDSNTVALGGGKIRSYTGTAWVEVAPGASGYADMWSVAGPDAWIWAQQQGQILAEATKLSTATAKAISDKQIVSSLPASPYTGYFVGDIVVLTTDNKLYRLTSSGWTKAVDGADATNIPITAFASGIRPTRVVASLPTSPFTGYVAGDTVVLTTDNKLYRFTGTAFTKAVDAVDIVANSITAGQIATGAIAADELASNAVTAVKIAAGVITADKMTVITKNKVNNLFGGVLADWSAGSIDTTTHTDKGPMLLLSTNNNLQSYSSWFEVDPTKSYEVEIWVRADVAKNSYYFGMNSALDSVGTEDSVIPTGYNYTTKTWGSFGAAQKNPYFTYNKDSRPTVWLKIRSYILGCNAVVADIPAPEGSSSYGVYAFKLLPTAKYARLRILNYNATTYGDGTLTNLWMYSPRVTEIGTGSIIAENIAAGSITASKIAVSDLAANSTFTNALNANTAYIASLAGQSAFFTALSAQTAFLEQLASKVAFIEALFANQVTVPAGGRIRYETGAGVQKRCVQLADEKIDWLDTPDTTPASAEQLRFRLGRLGVGSAVLMDGDFLANIDEPWGEESVINAAASSGADYIQLSNGELRVAYMRDSDRFIVERVWSGSAWGAEAVINAAVSFNPDYIQLSNGELRIAYTRDITGVLVERVWSGSAWGAEAVINAAGGSYPNYIQLSSGELRVSYFNSSHALVERVWSGSAWGEELVISAADSSGADYIQLSSGELRVAYVRYLHGTLVERVWSGSAWGAEAVISDIATVSYPNYTQLIDGELRVAYVRNSDLFLIERVWSGSAWGEELVISAASAHPDYIQLSSGELRIAYRRSSDTNLVERTLQRYAQVGAGIVASGVDPTTGYEWEIYGNGYKKMRGQISSAGSTNGMYVYFPKPFGAPPKVIHTTGMHTGGSILLAEPYGLAADAPTALRFRVVTTNALNGANGIPFMWSAEGY